MDFTLKTKFDKSAEVIYSTWLQSEGHSLMTGGEANITDKVGASFSAWDGYISGTNLVLEPFHRIQQSWRTSEFENNEPDSCIEILLEEVDGQTTLTLIHSGLSENGVQYIKGWEDFYFLPMMEYFSKL
ncbi:MAG: SRPBCC domain-containing protein [Saprospiraceae bacterium]